MLVLISPAKTLDFTSKLPNNLQTTIPEFSKEASELVKILQKYSVTNLSKLMGLSAKLAELNYQRFQDFATNETRPAIYAYNGDVYDGFELEKYSTVQQDFLNKTILIVSGLYGLLQPFDLIKPYRLEMSTSLPDSLYNFWHKKITDKLNSLSEDIIINLASKEYIDAVDISNLKKKMIAVTFKEKYQDGYKIIGIHAKKARGVMANYIVMNNITDPELLKNFTENNYRYSPQLSSKEEYVFIR